jgi:drug/metabolite transporter (DMT)-like permease
MKLKDYFLIILMGAMWGANLSFVKAGLSGGFTLFAFAGIRFFFAGVLLFLFFASKAFFFENISLKELVLSKSDLKDTLYLSAFMIFIPYSFSFFALTIVTSGIAGIVGATIPLFTMFFAHFLTSDEKLNITKITGFFICLFGLVLLAVYGKENVNLSLSKNFYKGFASGLLASMSIGFANVYTRKSKITKGFTVSTMYQCLISGAFFFLASFFFDNYAKIQPKSLAYLSAGYAVTIGTAIPFVVYYNMTKRLGASRISTVTFIIPFFAIICGRLILNEKITLMSAVAGIVTLIGIGFIMRGSKS